MRSAQSVSRAVNSISSPHMNSCPLPRQDASDRQNAPGGGAFVREDSLRESGLRPPSHPSSQELAGLPLPRRSHPGKNPCRTGKAPRQGISSSRVKADCPRTIRSSRRIDTPPVGTLWNTRFVVDCVGKVGDFGHSVMRTFGLMRNTLADMDVKLAVSSTLCSKVGANADSQIGAVGTKHV